jgi:hypothetical protein
MSEKREYQKKLYEEFKERKKEERERLYLKNKEKKEEKYWKDWQVYIKKQLLKKLKKELIKFKVE